MKEKSKKTTKKNKQTKTERSKGNRNYSERLELNELCIKVRFSPVNMSSFFSF